MFCCLSICVKSTCFNLRKINHEVTVLSDGITSWSKKKIPEIWNLLMEKGIANKELFQLENSDLFKYSISNQKKINRSERLTLLDCLLHYYKIQLPNLVELKSIHLNSDVFSSAVALKLRNRKNNVLRILRKAIIQISVNG